MRNGNRNLGVFCIECKSFEEELDFRALETRKFGHSEPIIVALTHDDQSYGETWSKGTDFWGLYVMYVTLVSKRVGFV